jgi:hypothetical protein
MTFKQQFIKAFANTSGALAAVGLFSLVARYVYKIYIVKPIKKTNNSELLD